VTYGEDWLVEIERVLQQEFIDRRTARIDLAAFWNWIFAISSWVNIVSAAREQDSLDPEQQLGDAVPALMEWNYYRSRPSGMERGKIGWQRALVVRWIAAGRLGNSDVD
jgi:hypothetical protein